MHDGALRPTSVLDSDHPAVAAFATDGRSDSLYRPFGRHDHTAT